MTLNVRTWLLNRVVIAYLLAAALMVIGGLLVPGFLTFKHVMTVIQASAFLGLITLGQTIVIISGSHAAHSNRRSDYQPRRRIFSGYHWCRA